MPEGVNLGSIEGQAISMWNRPGGKIKTILLLVALGFVFYQALPTLITLVNDTTELAWGITKGTAYIGLAALAVFTLYYFITSPKVKYGLMGFYDIIIDNTLGLIIEWDPKALLRARVKENYEEVEKMQKDIDGVAHKEEEVLADIKRNEARIKQIEEAQYSYTKLTPKQLEQRGLGPEDVASELSLLENEKAQLVDWNNQLQPIYDDILRARTGLEQLLKYAGHKAKWYEKNVEIEIRKFESLAKANSAAQRFMSILQGKGEKAYMADAALLQMQQKMAKDASEFKQVIRRSRDFVKSINLKEAQYDKAGLEYLQEFKAKYEQETKQLTGQSVVTTFVTPQQTVLQNKKHKDLLS